MKYNIFTLLLLCANFLNAQITFEKVIDVSQYDVGRTAIQTIDNHYVIVGHASKPSNPSDKDMLLVKADVFGDTLWCKVFDDVSDGMGRDVIETNDDNLVLAGTTNSPSGNDADIYLLKTDPSCNVLWSNAIGGAGDDYGLSVQQTPDNGYVITGYTSGNGIAHSNVFIAKANKNGDPVWMKNYGGEAPDRGNSVICTSDGGFVVCGYTRSFGAGMFDVYLIKINSEGDSLWTKTYGGPGTDCGMSIQQTTDNGFIIAGYTNSFGAGDSDIYLIRTDETGEVIWTTTIGGAFYDISTSVINSDDGGFIVAGYGESFGNNSIDAYLIKINHLGDTLWMQVFGDDFIDYGNSVMHTSDGGYLIGGTAFRENSWGLLSSDVYLIKTDENGLMVNIPETSEDGNGLKVYPNPNTGRFKIELEKETYIVEIFDINGRLCYKKDFFQKVSEQELKLDHIEHGLYFLMVYTDSQSYVEKLIIK